MSEHLCQAVKIFDSERWFSFGKAANESCWSWRWNKCYNASWVWVPLSTNANMWGWGEWYVWWSMWTNGSRSHYELLLVHKSGLIPGISWLRLYKDRWIGILMFPCIWKFVCPYSAMPIRLDSRKHSLDQGILWVFCVWGKKNTALGMRFYMGGWRCRRCICSIQHSVLVLFRAAFIQEFRMMHGVCPKCATPKIFEDGLMACFGDIT